MSRTHLNSPFRRTSTKLILAMIGVASFGACGSETTAPRANNTPGGSGSGGQVSGGAGYTATAGTGGVSTGGGGATAMAGSFNAAAGTLGTAGTFAGTGGGGGAQGGTGGAQGGTGGAQGGTGGGKAGNGGTGGGKAGAGGTGGAAGDPTGCTIVEEGGAGGMSGGGGAPANPCETNPLPLKTTWVATASTSAGGELPAEAIDAGAGTRWSSGKDQSGDEWLQIDFGVSVAISRVELTTTSANDFPDEFEIRVSDTPVDEAATPVASGAGSVNIVRCFTPTVGRYLLISQTGTGTHWWSVHNLNALCE